MTGSSPPPPLSVGVDPRYNWVVGVSYDANGNVTSSGGIGGYWQASYDVENRMISANGVGYAYDAQNHRILQEPNTQDSYGNPTGYTVCLWGANGQRLGSYQVSVNYCNSVPCLTDQVTMQDTYFGGRRLAPLDRIGSARAGQSFYPYGEDTGAERQLEIRELLAGFGHWLGLRESEILFE